MEPPKFVKPINAMEVKKGSAAHFVVEVSGTPTPQVTWYREGHQILHSDDFQIIQVLFRVSSLRQACRVDLSPMIFYVVGSECDASTAVL